MATAAGLCRCAVFTACTSRSTRRRGSWSSSTMKLVLPQRRSSTGDRHEAEGEAALPAVGAPASKHMAKGARARGSMPCCKPGRCKRGSTGVRVRAGTSLLSGNPNSRHRGQMARRRRWRRKRGHQAARRSSMPYMRVAQEAQAGAARAPQSRGQAAARRRGMTQRVRGHDGGAHQRRQRRGQNGRRR